MKFMLLIYDNEQAWTRIGEAEQRKVYGDYMQFTEDIKASRIQPGLSCIPSPPRVVCACVTAKELITDGPFAETHEQLGGYYLIEAKDLDEATKIAARIPSARYGTVEVRPLVERSAEATAQEGCIAIRETDGVRQLPQNFQSLIVDKTIRKFPVAA